MTPQELADGLAASKICVYDAETNGLDWRRCHTVGHVITLEDGRSGYFPFRHASGNGPDVTRIIKQAFARDDLTVIIHNAQFDLMFLAEEGIHVAGPVHDTMVMGALCNEHSPSFSLDGLGKEWQIKTKKLTNIYEFIAGWLHLDKSPKDIMSRYWELPGDNNVVSGYACGDGDATMALHARLKAEIEAQNLRKVFSVESELTPVLHRMSRRGWKIDEDRLHLVFEMANAKLEHAQRELPENLNVRSPIQMEKIFTDAGFKDWPHTQTGRASFPEAWLLTNLLGQRIVEARKWRTLLSTFIVPIMDEHLWKGRVHTNFNQLKADDYGTVTGRLSSNDPNMFNSPSPKKNPDQADLFRQIFIGDDGSEIVEQDMDQQEVRICAHFAQIKAWLDGYNSDPPIDAHSAVATATGLSRQNAKIINLALIMGAGMESTIQRLGMPYDDGRNVVLQYHEKVPELKAFQKFAANKWKQHGFIRSILGRRFRLIDDQKAYNALNRIVQGSAADICKLALTKCAKIGGVELINSIYDSIIYQRVDPRLDDDVTEAMCNHPELKLKVPLLTSFGSGGRWSDIG